MKITHGLLPGQVLQRDRKGWAGARIQGDCKAVGTVQVRVLKGNRVVRGHAWKTAGEARQKTFTASLSGLRTGGPYRVEIRINSGRRVTGRIRVDDIYVGDVWILAGQSNMEGVGNLAHAPQPHAKVRAFYMRDEWGMAEEKLHYLGEAVDVVHNSYGNEPGRPPASILARGREALVKGVSPGVVFGIEMYRRTRIPQGLIPCAHGGTSLAQWSPDLRDRGGASLYGAMMRRYEKLGQSIAGILWYQGESDANAEAAPVYTQKMKELVASSRHDMKLPQLPWVMVQLGCHAAREEDRSWNSIQEQQRKLAEVIPHLDVAPAIDLELDDGIHIGARGHQVLGRRLARLADRLVHKTAGVKPGIQLKELAMVPTPHCNVEAPCTSVEIAYANVAGRLVSDGRPAGFALLDHTGHDICGIYKTTISGNRVLLHTNMPRYQLEMLSVSYGHGRYPICTITDREQMSLPVMQAVPIMPDHMRACTAWKTTRLPGIHALSKASFSGVSRAVGWRKAPARAGFGVLPKPAQVKKTGVYALRTCVQAEAALEAGALFGANAPFRMWLNGKRVVEDRACAEPLDPGQYRLRLKLKAGHNEIHIAFAPPGPQAHLGLYLRIGNRNFRRDARIIL